MHLPPPHLLIVFQGGRGAADTGTRLLSALLTEMDGLEGATGVIVVGATNRPMALDSAMLRPGRLDVLLYVPPPDLEGRVEALRVHTRGMPLDEGLHLEVKAGAYYLYFCRGLTC